LKFTLGAAAMAGKEDRTVDCGEAGGLGDVVLYVLERDCLLDSCLLSHSTGTNWCQSRATVSKPADTVRHITL